MPPDGNGRYLSVRVQVGWGDCDPAGIVYFVNFFFQRVIGINRDCPWSVNFTSRVTCPQRITLHPSVRESIAVSGGCYIQATNGLEIGQDTIIAPGVKIITANHSLTDFNQWDAAPPIRIGSHCWLGANAVILPGVQLGDGVVVGAGSVVTKSFPDSCVIGGVPARVLRSREAVPS